MAMSKRLLCQKICRLSRIVRTRHGCSSLQKDELKQLYSYLSLKQKEVEDLELEISRLRTQLKSKGKYK